jgi:hypothetical protein
MHDWSPQSCKVGALLQICFAHGDTIARLEQQLAEARQAKAIATIELDRQISGVLETPIPAPRCPCVSPGPGRCEGNIPRYDRPG